MKQILTLFFLLLIKVTSGQTIVCGCKHDKFINESTTSCEVIKLKNGGSLYYQFNCDSVWLTLKTPDNKKHIIFSMTGETFKEFYGYTFRLGYQFQKEFERTILFRTACPANGPCNFILINKTSGRVEEVLGELIYDHEGPTFYNFLVYFTDGSKESITLYYVDSGKKYNFPINPAHFDSYFSEYYFNNIILEEDILKLSYSDNQNKAQTILIDLKNCCR